MHERQVALAKNVFARGVHCHEESVRVVVAEHVTADCSVCGEDHELAAQAVPRQPWKGVPAAQEHAALSSCQLPVYTVHSGVDSSYERRWGCADVSGGNCRPSVFCIVEQQLERKGKYRTLLQSARCSAASRASAAVA